MWPLDSSHIINFILFKCFQFRRWNIQTMCYTLLLRVFDQYIDYLDGLMLIKCFLSNPSHSTRRVSNDFLIIIQIKCAQKIKIKPNTGSRSNNPKLFLSDTTWKRNNLTTICIVSHKIANTLFLLEFIYYLSNTYKAQSKWDHGAVQVTDSTFSLQLGLSAISLYNLCSSQLNLLISCQQEFLTWNVINKVE